MAVVRKHVDQAMRFLFKPQTYYRYAEKFLGKNECYKIHMIDISEVRRWSGRDRSTRHDPSTLGAVWGGDWDIMPPRFSIIVSQVDHEFEDSSILEESIFYESFYDRFIKKRPWEETAIIGMLRRLVDKYGSLSWPTYSNHRRINDKCEMLDLMYQDFLDGRVLSQRERLIKNGNSIPIWKAALKEVLLDQARDGELILMDGRHRVILAKLAEVRFIPAIIAVRHENAPKL